MTDVLVGDALLELTKAKELANVMGGAWHSTEEDVDADSDAEQRRRSQQNGSGGPVTRPRDRRNEADGGLSNASGGGGGVGGLFSSMVTTPLRRTLSGYRRNDSSSGGGGSHNGTSNGHGNSNSNHGDSDHGDSGYSNGPTGTATTAGSNRGITSSGSFAAAFNSNNKSTKASPLLSMRNGRGAKDRRRSNGEAGGGRAIRRPADGRAPGRRDPVAVAKLEAAARQAAQQGEPDGVDRSWQLPTNVDYYTDRAALLRELVKEMPADKRLSFQTRVANARSKEAVESLLEDYATRLECLILPPARSREIDLHQVKKDTARERVVLDGKEMAFWGSPSDQPNSWHEELWATIETRVTEGLLRLGEDAKSSPNNQTPLDRVETSAAMMDKARALASEEWNKARAVAATSEVFKAMSRTGAGGDAYFALVALFCTEDKLVVPVHCQESPIKVDFLKEASSLSSSSTASSLSWRSGSSNSSTGGSNSTSGESTQKGSKRGAVGRGGDHVHVMVTVPSTFDIYLRDGKIAGDNGDGIDGSGGSKQNGGTRPKHMNNVRRSSSGGGGGGSGGGGGGGANHVGADASIAMHLVRVKAIVEEEIWVVGSTKTPASSHSKGTSRPPSFKAVAGSAGGGRDPNGIDDAPPTLRFLLDHSVNRGLHNSNGSALQLATNGRQARGRGVGGRRSSGGGGGGSGGSAPGESPSTTPPPPAPVPLLTLTRTERRMCVSVVPEPSAVSEMMRNFSRKIGVAVPSPQPPRILGM